MNKKEIECAIDKAQKGIGQYIEIMKTVHNVNVSIRQVANFRL